LIQNRYNKLKESLLKKYGFPVYKIPVDAGFTCPNRDGHLGWGGCIFCEETGSGFAIQNRGESIEKQVLKGIGRMKRRYPDAKFFVYFQNFTNTYAPPEVLDSKYREALCHPDVIGVDISTRPDCVPEEVLDVVEALSKQTHVTLEYGMQTANYRTLMKLNRGHTLGEFIDAVIRTKKRNLEVVAHIILNLPWDDRIDVIETAKILNALCVNGVKIHSLYIPKVSVMAGMYERGEIKICSLEEYINRVITFLEYLSPDIVIHRLVAEGPRNGCIFNNWGLLKIQVINAIDRELKSRDTWQGKQFRFRTAHFPRISGFL